MIGLRALRERCGALPAAIAALFAASLLIVAASQESGSPPDPHAAGKILVPAGASEVTYCDACHKTGCPTQHPELVAVTWQPQGRVVLGVRGEVTCGTCHTRGFRHRADAFLGRDQRALCDTCHYGAHNIPNAHAPAARCQDCHVIGAIALAHAAPAEAAAMRSDIDTQCIRCHYDGPITHPVGVPNTKKKAPDLPLAPDGSINCITCHYGHSSETRLSSLLRKDNSRGGLCLGCHDDL